MVLENIVSYTMSFSHKLSVKMSICVSSCVYMFNVHCLCGCEPFSGEICEDAVFL